MTGNAVEGRPRTLLIAPQPFYAWRGSPIRVGFNAQALVQLGWEVDLVVMPVGSDWQHPHVRVHRPVNLFRIRELPIGPSFPKAVLDLFLFALAWRVAGASKPAVVHGIEEAGAMAVLIGRRIGARVIFEKHSDPASYHGGYLRNAVMRTYAQVERFAIRHADAVIGTGPALVEQARTLCPTKPVYHIFDIPSSLAEPDSQKAQSVRASWGGPPNVVWALYVGSFAIYQGIELLFSSIPLACAQYPSLRFVIVGGKPEEIEQRKAQLARYGVQDRVLFVGHVPPDELPSVLAAADILLSPRIAGRNTPLKLLDYLKAGRAIVASDTEANRLILDHSVAELAEPTPENFAAAIARLASDPARRSQLGTRGAQLIRETYNFQEFTRRLGMCYEHVCSLRK